MFNHADNPTGLDCTHRQGPESQSSKYIWFKRLDGTSDFQSSLDSTRSATAHM